jgi:hypothetical protein
MRRRQVFVLAWAIQIVHADGRHAIAGEPDIPHVDARIVAVARLRSSRQPERAASRSNAASAQDDLKST